MRYWTLPAFWLAVAMPAAAAPCAGFTDVEDTHPFCSAVEWMRNRGVTLGCTATAYCPNDAVSRLAMAAFMQRLGRSLTPDVQYAEQAGGALAIDAGAIVCQSPQVAGVAYPRTASARGILTADVGSNAGLAIHVMESTDGGGTWSVKNAHAATAQGAHGWLNVSVGKGAIPVAANTVTRYGLRITRHGGGGGDIDAWNCQLEVVYASRTGTSSPF